MNPEVMVVPINPVGFLVPFVSLAIGQEASAVFGLRNKDFPDEGARMGVPKIVTKKTGYSPRFGTRVPAQVVEVICYPSTILAEEKDKDGNPSPMNQLPAEEGNYEVVSINAEMMEHTPMNFRTMLYNEWAGGGSPSGVVDAIMALTKTVLTDLPNDAEAQANVAEVLAWYDELIRSHQIWHDKASV
jgi:hypothetical protein